MEVIFISFLVQVRVRIGVMLQVGARMGLGLTLACCRRSNCRATKCATCVG